MSCRIEKVMIHSIRCFDLVVIGQNWMRGGNAAVEARVSWNVNCDYIQIARSTIRFSFDVFEEAAIQPLESTDETSQPKQFAKLKVSIKDCDSVR